MTSSATSETPGRGRSRTKNCGASDRYSLLVCVVLLACTTTAIFLAGGLAQGSLGIFLCGAGLVLTLCPPQTSVDWRLWSAGGATMLCASLSFLPARWFGVPEWRKVLASAPGIHLPLTISLVPQESAFWLAILGVSILIGLFVLAHPVRSPSLLAITTTAVVVCGSYAALAIYSKVSGWHYPYDGGATFGFFPNRNHTATFLVTGSILAVSLLTVALRDRYWGIALLVATSLTTCVTALFFFSGSRGGVVFLLAGTLLWILGLGRRHRDGRVLISVCALGLACSILLLASGSEVRNRLIQSFESKPTPASQENPINSSRSVGDDQSKRSSLDVPFDFRMLIYRDTLRLISDFPVTGTGLGSFIPNFAQYRKASLADSTALHPESDWLMLTAEAGVPTLLCVTLLGWLAARRLAAGREHPFWPLRWGCVAAGATAVLHGFVDVPSHRVALGWWILLLLGIGLQLRSHARPDKLRTQRILFMLGGIGALCLGAELVRAEWFGSPSLPPFRAAKAQQEILALFNLDKKESAIDKAREAIGDSPLASPLYYQLGVLLLFYQDTDDEVDRLFTIQRLLNPTLPEIPEQQGLAWLASDSARSGTLWADALRRRDRINRQMGGAADAGASTLSGMMERARLYPAAQEALFAPALRTPACTLAWFNGASTEVAGKHFEDLGSEPSFSDCLSEQQRQQYLISWYSKGNREALARFIDDHPTWQAAAWPVHVRQLTDAGKFELAVREAAKHYDVSLEPIITGSLGRSGEESAIRSDLQDFERYRNEGNSVAATRVLEEAGAHASGNSPDSAEYWRLRAAIAANDHVWERAWQNLKHQLSLTHPDDSLQ